MIKVAINGFGRIGRLAFREIAKSDKLEVVAINDLSSPAVLSYLLKYDSVHGTFNQNIKYTDNSLVVGEKEVAIYAERDPCNLPWEKLQIDLVLECTGLFTTKKKAKAHLEAGANKVIISAFR